MWFFRVFFVQLMFSVGLVFLFCLVFRFLEDSLYKISGMKRFFILNFSQIPKDWIDTEREILLLCFL